MQPVSRTSLILLTIQLVLAPLLTSIASDRTIYDGRGERGKGPVDGSGGYSGSSGGGHGGDGTNAIAPEDAEHSRPIELELTESSDGRFKVSAQMKNRDGTLKKQFDHLFEIDANGYILTDHSGLTNHYQSIRIDTSGVTGHRGGFGGDGGPGGRGRRGTDATRVSRGTDGGRGGRGGDSGAGTHGAHSGHAATSKVYLDEDVTHLLMHLDETSPGLRDGHISGGAATSAGRHGTPGRGGPGGAGGSSKTWTTVTHHTRQVSDGRGGTRTEHYTRTHSHYMPGGSTGPRGSSGSSPSRRLRGGNAGEDAQFEINIRGKNGKITTYRNGRYDLKITKKASFKSASAFQGIVDGIIEPDEMVEVSYIVENNSQMPTPKRVARLSVLDSKGVRIEGQYNEVTIPSLKPGERYTVPPVYVRAHSEYSLPIRGNAKYEDGTFVPRVTQTGTASLPENEKVYRRANQLTGFRISQAIQLSDAEDIIGTTTLVPGKDTTVIQLKVTNNSGVNSIGQDAPKSRQVHTRQTFVNTDGISAQDIVVTGPNGKKISLVDEVKTTHRLLAPGESKVLNLKLSLKAGKEPYTAGKLRTFLNRGPLTDLLGLEDIQIQDVKLQSVKVFDAKINPDIILVTNTETPKEAVKAYKKTMKNLYGLIVEDYNISYYSSLDPNKPPLSSLKEGKQRTLVIMNNEHGVEAQRAAERLKLQQTLRNAHQNGMQTMFLGPGSVSSNLETRLTPIEKDPKHTHHKSKGKFLRALSRGEVAAKTIDPKTVDTVQVKQRFRWNKTNDKKMRKQAKKMADKLSAYHPVGRYQLVRTPGNDGSVPEKTFWAEAWRRFKNFFKNRPVGSFTLIRTSDVNETSVSHLKISKEQMNHPDFVKTKDFQVAFIKQLPFRSKLQLLDSLSDRKLKDSRLTPSARGPLYDAILSDLSEEFRLIRYKASRGYQKLNAFYEFPFREASPGTFKGAFFTDLLADLKFLYETGESESTPKKLVRRFIGKNSVFERDDFDDNLGEARKAVEERYNAHKDDLAIKRKENSLKIKAAKKARNAAMPWWKKIFIIPMFLEPKYDAYGNLLADSLHNIRNNTFVIERYEALGYGSDMGRYAFDDNPIIDQSTFEEIAQARAKYDTSVDERSLYDQVQRAKNTGKNEKAPTRYSDVNPKKHTLRCLLDELSVR